MLRVRSVAFLRFKAILFVIRICIFYLQLIHAHADMCCYSLIYGDVGNGENRRRRH